MDIWNRNQNFDNKGSSLRHWLNVLLIFLHSSVNVNKKKYSLHRHVLFCIDRALCSLALTHTPFQERYIYTKFVPFLILLQTIPVGFTFIYEGIWFRRPCFLFHGPGFYVFLCRRQPVPRQRSLKRDQY